MTTGLMNTPLSDLHLALNARMTCFGGWNMPLQYTSLMDEHLAVRQHAGIFDLSHMAEIEIKGEESKYFLQEMTTNDISRLEVGQAIYSCLCANDGGILDDVLVYRWEDSYWMVANAGNRMKVWNWLGQGAKNYRVDLRDLTESTALIAIQGPKAEEVLSSFVQGLKLSDIDFYRAVHGTVCGHSGVISRTGYTGEDGFELYFDNKSARDIWDALLKVEGVLPVGLGARDTLRLESGFSLYGNELNEERNPYQVSLGWVTKTETDPAPLAAPALRQAKQQATTCIVGLEMEGRSLARTGYPVRFEGRIIGEITSGSFSPSLKKGVALALVERSVRPPGTSVEVLVRDKPQPAKVVALPFVRGSVKRHS